METTILCSGFGLGFYIPGLLLRSSFLKKGVHAEIDVFEYYMQRDKKDKITVSKKVYQDNFAIAKMATRYPIEIEKSLDIKSVNIMLDKWRQEGRRNFISLSGHWNYILDLYKERIAPENICVDLLYVDSGLAPSWKSLKKYRPDYNHEYTERLLYNYDNKSINYTINVDAPIIPYNQRQNRLVVHGGGWGLGTYKETIEKLNKLYNLDIVAYTEGDIDFTKENITYYMNDPNWKAWIPNADEQFTFPPFIKITDTTNTFQLTQDHHWLFDVSMKCKGIVSKPGAGTLIDSFDTATPLIMLEPFGEHERMNSIIWEELGFGISYSTWLEKGASLKLLEQMHDRLLQSQEAQTDYSDFYTKYISGGA